MKRYRSDFPSSSQPCKRRKYHCNFRKSSGYSCSEDDGVESLCNISAKVVAANIPFELIEKRCEIIPEPVQEKIIYFSFPQNETDIYIYSSFSTSDKINEKDKLPYYQGVKLLEQKCVQNVIQIGFHLTGTVKDSCRPSCSSKPHQNCADFQVSISFDRCKITSVNCGCEDKGIFWCQHVVALTLLRIRRPDLVEFRVPISESLMQMDRNQLQKFAQYLIASHPNEVLPSAQRIADEILVPASGINNIPGAPDPTAGGGVDEMSNWHLDEDQIRDQVRSHLSNLACDESSPQLIAMCCKVRQMFRVRDSNGPRMLTIITQQFLSDPRLQVFKSRRTEMWQAYRQLWEELSSLWVCVLLNPLASREHRCHWTDLVASWTTPGRLCPTENWEVDEEEIEEGGQVPRKPTVFQLALNAAALTWEDEKLHCILHSGSTASWDEPFPLACMRVHALRCNGFDSQALALAVAVARSLNSRQPPKHAPYRAPEEPATQRPPPLTFPMTGSTLATSATIESLSSPTGITGLPIHHSTSESHPSHSQSTALQSHPGLVTPRRGGGHSLDCPTNSEGWIGMPGDPLGCLVECLLEASRPPDTSSSLPHHFLIPSTLATVPTTSTSPTTSSATGDPTLPTSVPTSNAGSNPPGTSTASWTTSPSTPPHYIHINIPGDEPPAPTYLCLALQIAITGLCQQRSMPVGLHRQEKAMAQESCLLRLLTPLPLPSDTLLSRTLVLCVENQLSSGWWSGLGQEVHTDTFPMHSVALWLFNRLHTIQPQLAFKLATTAMRLPVLESLSDGEEPVDFSSLMVSRFPRWGVLRSVETRQCELASALIHAAKDSIQQLDLVMNICDRHIHTAAMLFKLSQEVYNIANRHVYLLCAAFHLALNVSVRTLHRVNWRRREMVGWSVSCALEVGPTAVLHLVGGWANYTRPREAVQHVAPALLAPAALLAFPQPSQEQIVHAVTQLALQAAMKDPVHCSLPALSLLEKDRTAFETGYKLVCEAAERGAIGPDQLFALARYMEHNGCATNAFTLALHAMRLFRLSSQQECHPRAADVLWACLFSHSMGRSNLHEMLVHVVRNVHCPTLLADILHRCTDIHHPNPPPPPHDPAKPPVHQNTHSHPPQQQLALDKPPLRMLLDAALTAFVSTTHARLANISPRQYGEFLDFLSKARDTFNMVQLDGRIQFRQLLDTMKQSYKGKRKLMYLLRERFGY